MLVLVTHREDLTADLVVAELQDRGAEYLRFNSEDYPVGAQLTWRPGCARLSVGDRVLGVDEIDAIWWRRPLTPRLPPGRHGAQAVWAAGEAQAALEGFWRMTSAHWVNRPEANDAADCKPEQLVRALALGFEVPETLVTNDRAEARGFARPGRTVCKTLRDGVVPTPAGEELFFTELVDERRLDAIDELGPEPYMFQSLVDKAYDVRVTVIGDEALACRIESQVQPETTIDWRLGDAEELSHEVEDLPPELAARCVALTHSYGLRYAALDLARRADGGYSFFELNPNGEWGWLEQRTDLAIRSRLVDELIGGRG